MLNMVVYGMFCLFLFSNCLFFKISNDARAVRSLITTSHLPTNVIEIKDVEEFYEKALEKNKLGARVFFLLYINRKDTFFKRSSNRIKGRLQDPSQLRGPTIEILELGEEETAGDIVLSLADIYFSFLLDVH
jgi:hypothetical protein